jgi:hypothetical protein
MKGQTSVKTKGVICNIVNTAEKGTDTVSFSSTDGECCCFILPHIKNCMNLIHILYRVTYCLMF